MGSSRMPSIRGPSETSGISNGGSGIADLIIRGGADCDGVSDASTLLAFGHPTCGSNASRRKTRWTGKEIRLKYKLAKALLHDSSNGISSERDLNLQEIIPIRNSALLDLPAKHAGS